MLHTPLICFTFFTYGCCLYFVFNLTECDNYVQYVDIHLAFQQNLPNIYLIASAFINPLTGIMNLDFNSANSGETVCWILCEHWLYLDYTQSRINLLSIVIQKPGHEATVATQHHRHLVSLMGHFSKVLLRRNANFKLQHGLLICVKKDILTVANPQYECRDCA